MASSLIPPGTDLCAIPIVSPPNGQVPNFENPASLTTTTIVLGVLMAIWAVIFVAARVVVNRRNLSWSDYFMVIGLVCNIAFTGVFISISNYNRHMWDVPVCWMTPLFMKLQFVITMLVGPASYFSKSSIFLLYRQFFSVKKSMRIAVYIGLVATFLVYFPTIPLSILYTTPHGGLTWADLFTSDEPAKLVYLSMTTGTLAVVLDIYIFVLPLPTLAALNMSFRTRMQLIAVFSTALMGVVASVVALVYRVKLLSRTDPTWQQGAFYVSVMVENNIAIIVGSMPAVATFVRVYVSELSAIKALRLKLRGATGDHSDGSSEPSFPRKDLATIGSPNAPRNGPRKAPRPVSPELTGTTATTAETIPDKDYVSLSSTRTAESHSHCAEPNFAERLV